MGGSNTTTSNLFILSETEPHAGASAVSRQQKIPALSKSIFPYFTGFHNYL